MSDPHSNLALPVLRQELRLFRGPAGQSGTGWLLYDPVRHRYFQIDKSSFDLLTHWRADCVADFAQEVSHEIGRKVSAGEVGQLIKFVLANNLALEPPNGDARSFAAQEKGARRSFGFRALHGYLFFKVPLVRPHRFLKATLPLVEPLYGRTARISLLAIALAGLYLTSRQWDLFVATFLDFMSLEGFAAYALTLLLVKTLHELGHAYTATRLGVRVNTMGVAFMVLAPILYTDVTDAWRLQRARDKLAIDGAGIAVELALAAMATFLWAFLSDGPLRSAAFALATTGWVTSLIINLNPLMRFDGYYLLSDGWQIPNLQSRSNAFARWWVRETLFASGRPPPEPAAPARRRLMVAYAIAVWIYRLFLFIGIALIVYHLFFKALGVVLFVVEIVWFILLPIFKEITEWWKMRNELMTARTMISAATTVGLIVALCIPWTSTLQVQAVMTSDQETHIFAPRAGRIEAIHVSEELPVAAGQDLLVLRAPDLDHDISQTRRQIELSTLRLNRIAGDTADRSNRMILESELSRHRTSLSGLEAERSRLAIRAPHDGLSRDVDPDLAIGEWIDGSVPIARIVATSRAIASGYVAEENLWRISPGTEATFIPEDPTLPALSGRIAEVSRTGARAIELLYLSSVFGGSVPTTRAPDNEIRPRSGYHLVRIALDAEPEHRAMRGTLHLAATGESFATSIWRRILQILVRESSA